MTVEPKEQPEPAPFNTEKETGNQRPFIVTIICILGFLDVIASLPIIFFGPTQNFIVPWFPIALAAFSAVEFIALLGVWKMRKWAVILYTIQFATVQAIMLMLGDWSITSLLTPAGLLVIIFFSQYAKMN